MYWRVPVRELFPDQEYRSFIVNLSFLLKGVGDVSRVYSMVSIITVAAEFI